MDISKKSDRGKSVLLARAMGWYVCHRPTKSESNYWSRGSYYIVDSEGKRIPRMAGNWQPGFSPEPEDGPIASMMLLDDFPKFDLYAPKYMDQAWRVLNWASDPDESPWSLAILSGDFVLDDYLFQFPIWRKADAQRIWLDKILELLVQTVYLEESAGLPDAQPAGPLQAASS